MSLVIRLITSLLCFVHSASVTAKEPWFLRELFNTSPQKPSATQYVNDADLFECGVETYTLCSDEISYYRTRVFLEVLVEGSDVSRVVMNADFSNHVYSELQLNLRKDGFQLASFDIDGNEFNVEKRLMNATNEERVEVDKELVTFINRYPNWTYVKSRWKVNGQRFPVVHLESNGGEIQVRLVRD
ncbi:hypothetical protein [Vibrio profundi]|uniref:hypothetical protein n=1 Tax=Vibrio profundi TaxID=1774960 RepID=UPI003735289B